MDIDRMLLKAISQGKTIEFLRGEGECCHLNYKNGYTYDSVTKTMVKQQR